jgi:hypothetical protein
LDDACQLPKGIVAPGDAVQLPALEGSRLDGRRRDDVAHLLEILLTPGRPWHHSRGSYRWTEHHDTTTEL